MVGTCPHIPKCFGAPDKYCVAFETESLFSLIDFNFCNQIFTFSSCNDYQDIYKTFTEEVDKATYSAIIHLMKKFYPSCKSFRAWNPTFVEEYKKCTNNIIEESTFSIKDNTDTIQLFALSIFRGLSIKTEFDKVLKDIDIEDDFKMNIKVAIAHFEKVSLPSTLSCLEINRCLEIMREVILRLKLIEWGGLGHKVSNAGVFLAFHHNMLGCVMTV